MPQNKIILVTGATSGVGLAITNQLLAQNFDVIAIGRNDTILQQLAKKGAEVFKVDLLNVEAVHEFTNKVREVDVAILNAGVGIFEYAHLIEEQSIDDMISLNISSQMKLTKALIPKVKQQFIYIGSQAGKVATPKAAVYAATKHALIGYTNGLRLEQPNLIITIVHPGPIDTPFLDHADATGSYRGKMKNVLLSSEKVAEKTISLIGKNKRELNIPWYMGITSKLYAVAPALTETIGKPFFNKK